MKNLNQSSHNFDEVRIDEELISLYRVGDVILDNRKSDEGMHNMDKNFIEQIDGLMEKYTELLVGEASAENIDKVRTWILYSHIAKSMPPLAKHWNAEYPDAKEQIKNVISEVKELNEKNRQK